MGIIVANIARISTTDNNWSAQLSTQGFKISKRVASELGLSKDDTVSFGKMVDGEHDGKLVFFKSPTSSIKFNEKNIVSNTALKTALVAISDVPELSGWILEYNVSEVAVDSVVGNYIALTYKDKSPARKIVRKAVKTSDNEEATVETSSEDSTSPESDDDFSLEVAQPSKKTVSKD